MLRIVIMQNIRLVYRYTNLVTVVYPVSRRNGKNISLYCTFMLYHMNSTVITALHS